MVLHYIYEKVTCCFGAAAIIAACKGLRNLSAGAFVFLKMFLIEVCGQTFGSPVIVCAISPHLFHAFNQRFDALMKRGKNGFSGVGSRIQLLAQPRDNKENKYRKLVKCLLSLRRVCVSSLASLM